MAEPILELELEKKTKDKFERKETVEELEPISGSTSNLIPFVPNTLSYPQSF